MIDLGVNFDGNHPLQEGFSFKESFFSQIHADDQP